MVRLEYLNGEMGRQKNLNGLLNSLVQMYFSTNLVYEVTRIMSWISKWSVNLVFLIAIFTLTSTKLHSQENTLVLGTLHFDIKGDWHVGKDTITGPDFGVIQLISPDQDTIGIFSGNFLNVKSPVKSRTRHFLQEWSFDTTWVQFCHDELLLAEQQGILTKTIADSSTYNYETKQLDPPPTDSLALLIGCNSITNIWGLGPLESEVSPVDIYIEFRDESSQDYLHFFHKELDHKAFMELMNMCLSIRILEE